ncbi:carbon-nitrogen hydrolase family protein [Nocardioides daejeonensis]|uniref:carbon-nitrogen hydrolase family protein n=1 Tax=Nocardioides daejeonensis TaxID=1046556 RepID=UPI000D743A2C|nr:carbon-nitrogen hydrolase family protein [Nocardioides daejeonensis]
MTVIALEQTAPQIGEVEENTAEIAARATRALQDGADIVVLPELASSGYVVDPATVDRCAQPLDGPLVATLTGITRRLGGLITVGFPERDGVEIFNTVAVVGPDGPVLRYRKLHLFDAEQLAYTPGDDLPVVATDYGKLGVCVCYDLRFVEVLRSLSLRGAEIVLAPAAWVGGFDNRVPENGLVQQAQAVVVQANLDQVAVVGVSQAPGPGQDGVVPLGGSLAVDARGQLVAGPLSRRGPDSAVATIDPVEVRAARRRGPRINPREDRRTDLYRVQYLEELL